MISLKKLIQTPGSPDIALKQKWKDSEAAGARLAHVNRLSRDIYDIVSYPVDFAGGTSVTVQIDSKKGILDIADADPTATTLSIQLVNSEIYVDHTKFYIQLTVYSDETGITPIVYGRGIVANGFDIQIKNLSAASAWGDLYVYYELIKID